MYVKPGHQVLPDRPPRETGERLATFPRGGSELRVTLAEYRGRPFVSLRVWEPSPDGAMWPTQGKGCSVRLSEARELAAVLAAAAGGRESDHGPPSVTDGV